MSSSKKLRKITDEQWRQIPWTDKKYEVSNYGRVKSYVQDKINGKILKPLSMRNFVGVNLTATGKQKFYMVHKIVAELFVLKTNENQDTVIHLDWNNSNNHYKNLKWVTKREAYDRMFQRIQENRKKQGKMITSSKLKEDDIRLLKSLLKRGVKQKLIAQMFCISEMQVTRIKRGENWGHVNPKD